MQIAAFVGVRDEAELIVPCLRRLVAIGVGALTVIDDNSADGTRELVNTYAATTPNVQLVSSHPQFGKNLLRHGPVLRPTIEAYAPEWVLHTDADEFWLAATDLSKSLNGFNEYDFLVIERFNLVPTADGIDTNNLDNPNFLLDAPLVAQRVVLSHDRMRAAPELRWVTHSIGPKIVCKADVFESFTIGGHSAVGPNGTPLRQAKGRDVLIIHVPFTSYDRFVRKVENIKRVFAQWDHEDAGATAWTWRRWIEIADSERLEKEFERQIYSPDELREGRAKGIIKTARELFAERGIDVCPR